MNEHLFSCFCTFSQNLLSLPSPGHSQRSLMPLLHSLLYLTLPHMTPLFFLLPLFHFYPLFFPPSAKTTLQKKETKIRSRSFIVNSSTEGWQARFCCVRSVGCTNVLTLTPEWSSVSGVCTVMLISAGDRLRADTDTYAAS